MFGKNQLLAQKDEQLKWEIEQQKKIIERVSQAAQETEQIFNVTVPLWVVSKEYKVLRVNDSFCDFFSVQREKIVTQSCFSIWSSSLCQTEQCPLYQIVEKAAKNYSTEAIKTMYHTVPRICSISAKPFYDKFNNVIGMVESFIDISTSKSLEQEIEKNRQQLFEQNEMLSSKNYALRELISQVQKEKERTEEQILERMDKLVMPFMAKLKELCQDQALTYITIIEHNLNELTSTFNNSIMQKFIKMTPKEIEICNMIKNGLSSKDIAQIMHVSPKTIETHRKNIRKKLKLTKKHRNLFSYLLTINK